ncbi:TetR/AcrR family transcriptional regulator [Seinonella peptonophila]|nr:TetR/AcrR family transcriptional regulator [Seinonella peptonophila]
MKKNFHIDSKRQDIIQAATFLFATKGIDGTSMKSIGKAANVSDAAIYKHFASKKELLQLIYKKYNDYFTQMIDEIAQRKQPFRKSFQELIQLFFEAYVADQYGLMLLYQNHDYCTEIAINLRLPLTALSEFIQGGVDAGELPEQNPEVTATMIIGALTRLAIFSEIRALSASLDSLFPDIHKRLLNLVGLL